MTEFGTGWSGNRKESFVKQNAVSLNFFELYLLLGRYLNQSLSHSKNTFSFTSVYFLTFLFFNLMVTLSDSGFKYIEKNHILFMPITRRHLLPMYSCFVYTEILLFSVATFINYFSQIWIICCSFYISTSCLTLSLYVLEKASFFKSHEPTSASFTVVS